MAFEALKAQIALMFEDMVEEPENAHEALMIIRERIAELRASGMPVPTDLTDVERALERLERR